MPATARSPAGRCSRVVRNSSASVRVIGSSASALSPDPVRSAVPIRTWVRENSRSRGGAVMSTLRIRSRFSERRVRTRMPRRSSNRSGNTR